MCERNGNSNEEMENLPKKTKRNPGTENYNNWNKKIP